jgi:transmembrane 9 superfamily protein 2/4
VYTYDIKWERSELRWSNRWDVYLKGNPDDEIHYFSIVNSLMIVLFLTGVVAMIMLRTLHKDISSYNEMQTLEEAQEESGWKLVHGDVFRPPAFSPMLLSVLAGEITRDETLLKKYKQKNSPFCIQNMIHGHTSFSLSLLHTWFYRV